MEGGWPKIKLYALNMSQILKNQHQETWRARYRVTVRCPVVQVSQQWWMKGGKVRNIFKWHIHVFRCIDVHKGKTLYFICEETKNKGFKKLSRRELLLQSLNNSDLLFRMYGHESRKQNQTKQPPNSSEKNKIRYLAGDSMPKWQNCLL